jgi:hypothetical protein
MSRDPSRLAPEFAHVQQGFPRSYTYSWEVRLMDSGYSPDARPNVGIGHTSVGHRLSSPYLTALTI